MHLVWLHVTVHINFPLYQNHYSQINFYFLITQVLVCKHTGTVFFVYKRRDLNGASWILFWYFFLKFFDTCPFHLQWMWCMNLYATSSCNDKFHFHVKPIIYCQRIVYSWIFQTVVPGSVESASCSCQIFWRHFWTFVTFRIFFGRYKINNVLLRETARDIPPAA